MRVLPLPRTLAPHVWLFPQGIARANDGQELGSEDRRDLSFVFASVIVLQFVLDIHGRGLGVRSSTSRPAGRRVTPTAIAGFDGLECVNFKSLAIRMIC
jgi:hypothetical protein